MSEEQDLYPKLECLADPSAAVRRPVLKWALFILVGFAVLYIALRIRSSPRTVLAEERAAGAYVRFGFSVKECRFGAVSGAWGTTIRFWGEDPKGIFEDTDLNTPRASLVNIEQHEWLAKNQALLLRLDMYENFASYGQPEKRWMLYNFGTGDVTICNSFTDDPCAALQAEAQKLR